jgi:hypothetical protein
MECDNCKTEIKDKLNFCPECGEKIKPLGNRELSVEKTCNDVADCWFMLGAVYGACYVKKDKEGIEELGTKIRAVDEEVCLKYRQRVLNVNKRIGIKDDN